MANCGGEDEDWGEGSGDEEEREEGDDDLIVVESSGSRDCMKPILRLSDKRKICRIVKQMKQSNNLRLLQN
jgi:hypothetical protein